MLTVSYEMLRSLAIRALQNIRHSHSRSHPVHARTGQGSHLGVWVPGSLQGPEWRRGSVAARLSALGSRVGAAAAAGASVEVLMTR